MNTKAPISSWDLADRSVPFKDGTSAEFVVPGFDGRDGLIGEIASVFRARGMARGFTRSTYRKLRAACITLLRATDSATDRPITLVEILPVHLQAGERWARDHTRGDPAGAAYAYATGIRRALLVAMRAWPERFDDRTRKAVFEMRGSFGAVPQRQPISTPVEPITDEQAALLRRQLPVQIEEARAAARAEPPAALRPMLERIRRDGPLRHGDLSRAERGLFTKEWGLRRLTSLVFPTQTELAPYLMLLMLDLAMEPECVKTLTRDCIQNEFHGRGDITWFKARAGVGPASNKEQRRPTVGVMQPGWLIKQVLERTAAADCFVRQNALWSVHVAHGKATATVFRLPNRLGVAPWRRSPKAEYDPVRMVVERACAAEGMEPFAVHLGALRKIGKVEGLRAAGGDPVAGTKHHSLHVAVKHYFEVAALNETYVQVVVDGLMEAWADAKASGRVGEPDVIGSAVATGAPCPTREETLVGRAIAMYTNECHGFFDAAGRECPVAFWGCLSCPNAIITVDHLPNIFKFVRYAVGQIDSDGSALESWFEMFGVVIAILSEVILPRFSADEIATAANLDENGQSRIFLPMTPASPQEVR
ncbi:hypothetical protein [Curtobacterium sp. VKM Ac-1393]|uniref:hypothetical protein n=1 Tax=Curtobacterium sp. VKM Ac-1393 TaxID=2783814 RepID=UPI00188A7D8A|nr:hypothetical protein [Curtobacterium sp. VKM Ac-1393]MBF4608922.1 hypothetical protein [Curtobacterium sp. VKM Ac-1393]